MSADIAAAASAFLMFLAAYFTAAFVFREARASLPTAEAPKRKRKIVLADDGELTEDCCE